ncbi:MAG: putative molecular chaperone with protein kinase domain [Actinomycetia bacterium]|nr:putative molecular chaperone with protein kinase domain [Actinomycetes bacterium]
MQPLSPADPRIAGEFTLRARLGAGGMGRVYLGYSPAGRAVAVKVVHPELARDEEFLARFRNEVAAAGMVSGMYTAPVVASGLNDNPPWLATVYVPGLPLDDVVAENGPLPEGALWRLAAGLTEALQAVHASGLVHRDLKPSNVLLAADGPHVIDFGISRAMDGSHLTATGMVVGTPGYMSPEQAEGNEAGPPSDIFSLACVVAFAATGKQPFGTGSAASVLFRVVAGQPDLDGVPPQLRQVLEACLRKNPAERPQLPTLMVTSSNGAASVPVEMQSPSSFWPRPVEDVIRAAVQGAPAGPGTGPGTASPISPPPGSMQGVPSGAVQGAPSGFAQGPPSGFQGSPQGSPYTPPPPSMPGSPQAPGPYTGHPGAYAGQPGAYAGQASARQPVYPPASGYQPPSYGQAVPPGPQTPPPAPQAQTWQTPGARSGMQAASQTPQQARQPTPPQQAWQQTAQPQAPWQGPGMQPQVPPSGAAPSWTGQPGAGRHAAGHPVPGSVAAYQPGRRKPARAEIPSGAMTGIWLMYAGAVVTALYVLVGFPAYGRLSRLGTNHPHTFTQQHAYDSAGIVLGFVIVSGFLGIAGWLISAQGVSRGRRWGATLGTVLFGIDTIAVLFVLVGAWGAPVAKSLSAVVWAVGLVTVICLWSRASRAFYRAFG